MQPGQPLQPFTHLPKNDRERGGGRETEKEREREGGREKEAFTGAHTAERQVGIDTDTAALLQSGVYIPVHLFCGSC